MSKKQIVVVLGMHRSGTSAISRGLKALSVDLGDNLMPPATDNNERGFWEDMDIYRFNEKLFAKIETSWDRITPVETSLLIGEQFADARYEASSLLAAKLASTQVFGFKDPRTSVLLPFWRCVFDDLDLDQKYIIAHRNPLEVAASLQKRDKFDHRFGLFLWLKYAWATIENTDDCDRLVLSYQRLLAEPHSELSRIAHFLGLPAPHPSDPSVSEYLNDFLSSELQHNRISDNELLRHSGMPPAMKSLHEALREWAGSTSGFELPQELRTETGQYLDRNRYLFELCDLLKQQAASSENARAALSSITVDQKAQLAEYAERTSKLESNEVSAQQQIESLQQKLDGALSTVHKSNERIASLEALYDGALKENEALQLRLGSSMAEFRQCNQRLLAAELAAEELRADMSRLTETNDESLSRINELQRQLSESEALGASLKETTFRFQTQVAEAESKIITLLEADADKTKALRLARNELQTLTSMKTTELEYARNAESRLSQLECQLVRSETCISDVQTLLEQRKQECAEAQSELHELLQTADALHLKLAEKTVVVRLLRHEVYALRSSTSWKVTRPLRLASSLLSRATQFVRPSNSREQNDKH